MSEPAELIRRHLNEEGGSTTATVEHLLTTFEVEQDDAAGRERIVAQLEAAGVRAAPPLVGLETDEEVLLSTVERGPSEPPWQRPMEHDDGDPRDRGPRLARRVGVIGLTLLLAAGAAIGSYAYGESQGEDLEAARAAGERQGIREGTARGTDRGYRNGLKQGRRVGYKQTYRRAYIRAYRKEFREAGLAVPKKVKVP